MDVLNDIYATITAEGFSTGSLQMIDNYAKDIQNGTEDFSRFNLSEHAGLSTGGAPLIGASIVACYATASITAGSNAESREGGPANWEIDELQRTVPLLQPLLHYFQLLTLERRKSVIQEVMRSLDVRPRQLSRVTGMNYETIRNIAKKLP